MKKQNLKTLAKMHITSVQIKKEVFVFRCPSCKKKIIQHLSEAQTLYNAEKHLEKCLKHGSDDNANTN